MTAQIFAIIAPVFLIAAIGYVWARQKMPFDHNMVSALVLHVGAPCLLLSQLLTHRVDLDVMTEILVAGVIVILLTAVAGLAVLKLLGKPIRAYLPAMMFPNVGNMGLPLCLFCVWRCGASVGGGVFRRDIAVSIQLGYWHRAWALRLRTVLAQSGAVDTSFSSGAVGDQYNTAHMDAQHTDDRRQFRYSSDANVAGHVARDTVGTWFGAGCVVLGLPFGGGLSRGVGCCDDVGVRGANARRDPHSKQHADGSVQLFISPCATITAPAMWRGLCWFQLLCRSSRCRCC